MTARFDWPAHSFAVAAALGGVLAVVLGFLIAVQANLWQDQGNVRDALDAALVGQIATKPAALAQAAVATLKPADASYYEQIRKRLRWVSTRFGGADLQTPDLDSRVLLAKAAAERAKLADVGLSYRDVYGIINAETSWVPRTGFGKNGTPSNGIAQFEPATARALGLINPNDPVEAIHVAALHMKEAAIWSADRLARLKLSAEDRAAKLREGVSIYYNLSSRGRSAWNGKNTAKLPRETRLHIENARAGAQEAAWVDAQIEAARYSNQSRAVASANNTIRTN